MEKFVYINSDDSDDYFKHNTPYKFKIHLKTPLILKGTWKVALVEFFAKTSSTNVQSRNKILHVFCNISRESLLNCELQPILRRFRNTKQNEWNYIFKSPFYIPLAKHEIYELEVYIKTFDGEFASFLQHPLMLTLHFLQLPPNHE